MLIRIIITAALVALFITLYRRWINGAKRPSAPATASMKKCAECGVHLPETDTITSGDLHFCSEQHRIEYHARHSSDD